MSSSDGELNVTPETVRLAAEGLNSELLPEKSKKTLYYRTVESKVK
jgi:hypothetical protein